MFGLKTIQKIKVISRFNKVLLVLFLSGFGELIYEAKLHKHIPFFHRIVRRKSRVNKSQLPKKLREALIKLGPVYIKFGQILSTRWDILPKEYTDEFEKLQAEVPTFPFALAKYSIENSFDKPLHKLFAEFERKPFASASLGQVYKAKLPTGEQVAVKVQRPKAKEQILLDTQVLLLLAHLAEKYVATAKAYNPTGVVQEFGRWTLNELDYRKEATNCEVFNSFFKEDAHIYGPKVYWEYSSDKVLTLEYIAGDSLHEILAGKNKEQVNRKLIAERIGESFIRQYFEYGYFHADPHPGNLFVVKNNNLVFLDFGMVGFLDQRLTNIASGMLLALMQRDVENLVALAMQIEESYDERLQTQDMDKLVKINSFRKDVTQLLLQWPKTDQAGQFSRLFFDSVNVAINNGLAVPVDMVMLSKSIMTLDTVVKELNPDMNLEKWEKPLVEKILQKKFHAGRLKSRMQNTSIVMDDLLRTLPESTAKIIGNLEKAKFGSDVNSQQLAEYEQFLNASYRVNNFVILIVLVFIVSVLAYQMNNQPKFFGLTVSQLGLYVGLVLIFIFIINNLFRKGK